MKKALVFITFLTTLHHVRGLMCYNCSNSDYNGEKNYTRHCFSMPSSSRTCPKNANYYCRTKFTLQDGMVTSVSRGCVSTLVDEDRTSISMPTANKCQTSLATHSNPVDITTCYYHCNSEKCNTEITTTLKNCTTNCYRAFGRGACNYITGTCVCNAGYTGWDCSRATQAPNYRSCFQCNSETDTNCSSPTNGTACPGFEQYCSTAQTAIFDLPRSTNPIRTIITRGCTSKLVAVDECQFSNIYNDTGLTSSGYTEYTCYSTCSTDNCNKNIPDGIISDTEQIAISCQQCNSTTGDCNPGRTLCPISSTHCKATVVYLISPKTDLNYEADPEYRLLSVVRECATAAVTAECKETDVTDSMSEVTCHESCQTDGCNTGWPVRPTCLQCSSKTYDLRDGYDTCLKNPNPARTCPNPYQKYCYTSDIGPRDGSQGYPRRIKRGCSYYNRNGCSTQTIRGVSVEQCNYTCTTDGCNVGNSGISCTSNAIASFTFTLFGWMLQFRF